MAIHFVCPNGHELSAPEERAGKPGKCPKCQMEFLVPELEEEEVREETDVTETVADNANQQDVIVFLCPNGHKLNGPARLKGKPGQCPHCGAKFRIPADDEDDEEPTVDTPEFVEPPQDVATLSDVEAVDETLETVEIIEETNESLPLADAVIEPAAPPALVGEHPFHALVHWLIEQRQVDQPLLIRLKDGEVIEVDRFSSDLSLASIAVFAVREAADRFSVVALPWADIGRIELHKVAALPQELFD